MEGEKVKVKWDKIWYPATILRRINDEEVEVEFEDPDFPVEIVPISDIKIVDVTSTAVSNKHIAGAFNWSLFKIFFTKTMGDREFISPLTVQELTDLD